jgi:serine protease Do
MHADRAWHPALGALLLLFSLLCPPALGAESGLQLFQKLAAEIVSVSDQIKPSVVHIEVLAKRADVRNRGLGSGLIISPDGKIVTNHHVIERAQVITVILDDKSKYEASVLRKDRQTDLALLQIKPQHPLPSAVLGDSDKVSVGEWVLAVGNPYGFDRTVSFGIVSGKGRYIPDIDSEVPLLNDFIQTDALIDPGSSGGPLVNLKGEVIGINSVGIGRGQGFTIPSNVVKEVITRAEVEGRIRRGWLGLYPQPLTREMAEYLRIPRVRGILISDVQADSPAARAGLQSGDILVSFKGMPVEAEQEEEVNRFVQLVTSQEPGTRVAIEIMRNGQKMEKTVEIGTQPKMDAREVDTDFGFTGKEITQTLALEYRLDGTTGVLVSYVSRGSPADMGGLEVGDVITGVDGKPVTTLEQFEAMLPGLNSRNRFLLTLLRGKIRRYALIDLGPGMPTGNGPAEPGH